MITIDSMLMDLAVNALNESDRKLALTDRESLLLRLLKVSEERGEFAQAVVGWTGQNPRKGMTHSEKEVIDELADVILTAMLALATMTDEWETVVADTYRRKLRRLVDATKSDPMVCPGLAEEAATAGMRDRRNDYPYMSAYDMRDEINRVIEYVQTGLEIIGRSRSYYESAETDPYAALVQDILNQRDEINQVIEYVQTGLEIIGRSRGYYVSAENVPYAELVQNILTQLNILISNEH